MEGLSPSDAIIFPILAGSTLVGLYLLIKWLDDLTLLNKILNWYFSVFGVLSIARFLSDSMVVITSYAFPTTYTTGGDTWQISSTDRKAICLTTDKTERRSPLPGLFSALSLPSKFALVFWSLREILTGRVRVHTYLRNLGDVGFRIGLQSLCGFFLAVAGVMYFNLVDKPWWLTNLLGLSFAYNALQMLSPTTFWTGTMILSTLFIYDIYFVFFTPLMVTVAKSLDIPAKLLFPRPAVPTDDPGKQALAMLGLGDIVLPGMVIGLALRFDLYLFYLRKQSHRDRLELLERPSSPETLPKIADAEDHSSAKRGIQTELVKAEYITATGGWGDRFWTTRKAKGEEYTQIGGTFPKTYFQASMTGYILSMITTLAVMEIFGHAQPALLYLVPGVLGCLWGTAFFNGDISLMWNYTEATEDENAKAGPQTSIATSSKQSIFSPFRQEKIAKKIEQKAEKLVDIHLDAASAEEETESPHTTEISNPHSPSPLPHNKESNNHLFLFSISLPEPPPVKPTSSENLTNKPNISPI
uniref:Peptidase A22B n=1 Tax=Peltigera membranacea TaxID=161997 RepID=A0A1Q1N587_9LECA|nr:peptidase A22B [Peltigera membranacea]